MGEMRQKRLFVEITGLKSLHLTTTINTVPPVSLYVVARIASVCQHQEAPPSETGHCGGAPAK
jgi:hypothetical protein